MWWLLPRAVPLYLSLFLSLPLSLCLPQPSSPLTSILYPGSCIFLFSVRSSCTSGSPASLGSSARRTLHPHRQIHLDLSRGAQASTATSGLAGGGGRRQRSVTESPGFIRANWLVGQHPPFRRHWLNTAACWQRRACHRTLRFLSLSHARKMISLEISRRSI